MKSMYGFTAVSGCALVAVTVYWLMYKKKRLNLRGKVVLITGASSGIGEACAHTFYKCGSKVILCARRLEELKRVKKDLAGLNVTNSVHPAEVLVMDLEDIGSLPIIAKEALHIYGGVDILVNNAGMSYRGEAIETSMDTHVRLMKVNYFGHIALTQALLPQMLQKKYGHIVAVSSLQGKFAIPFRSAYAASKHACQAFFDSLRAELTDTGVSVTVVSPGYVNTNLSKNAITSSGSAYGVLDETTSSGLPATYVADKIHESVCAQQGELLLGQWVHILVVYLRNILPNLFFRVMATRALKQRKKASKQN